MLGIKDLKEKIEITKKCDRGRLCQLNNSVIFSGKPIESEEFLYQMVEALGYYYR
jgi:hypothetical protein